MIKSNVLSFDPSSTITISTFLTTPFLIIFSKYYTYDTQFIITSKVSFIIVGSLSYSLYAGTTKLRSNSDFFSKFSSNNGFSIVIYYPFSYKIYL